MHKQFKRDTCAWRRGCAEKHTNQHEAASRHHDSDRNFTDNLPAVSHASIWLWRDKPFFQTVRLFIISYIAHELSTLHMLSRHVKINPLEQHVVETDLLRSPRSPKMRTTHLLRHALTYICGVFSLEITSWRSYFHMEGVKKSLFNRCLTHIRDAAHSEGTPALLALSVHQVRFRRMLETRGILHIEVARADSSSGW